MDQTQNQGCACSILILVPHEKWLLGWVFIPYTSCVCQVHLLSAANYCYHCRVRKGGREWQLDRWQFTGGRGSFFEMSLDLYLKIHPKHVFHSRILFLSHYLQKELHWFGENECSEQKHTLFCPVQKLSWSFSTLLKTRSVHLMSLCHDFWKEMQKNLWHFELHKWIYI